MTFIQQYSEEPTPPKETQEIIDAEIISERVIAKDEAEKENTEVFSEAPKDTVQETKAEAPKPRRAKKKPEIGDEVTCLVESDDRTTYVCVEAKIIRISVLPDSNHGKITLCLLDTGTMIVVGTELDIALAELSGMPPGVPEADFISIQSQKYSKKGFGRTWVIDKLWKKISTGKRPGGKRH